MPPLDLILRVFFKPFGKSASLTKGVARLVVVELVEQDDRPLAQQSGKIIQRQLGRLIDVAVDVGNQAAFKPEFSMGFLRIGKGFREATLARENSFGVGAHADHVMPEGLDVRIVIQIDIPLVGHGVPNTGKAVEADEPHSGHPPAHRLPFEAHGPTIKYTKFEVVTFHLEFRNEFCAMEHKCSLR